MEASEIGNLIEWLQEQAQKKHKRVVFYPDLARRDGRFVYLPAHVDAKMSAFPAAKLLQDLEDTWNDQKPSPNTLLLLIPTRD